MDLIKKLFNMNIVYPAIIVCSVLFFIIGIIMSFGSAGGVYYYSDCFDDGSFGGSNIQVCESAKGHSWEYENTIEAFNTSGGPYSANLPLYNWVRNQRWKTDNTSRLAYVELDGEKWYPIAVGYYYLPRKEGNGSVGSPLISIYTCTNESGAFEPVKYTLTTDNGTVMNCVAIDCFGSDGTYGSTQSDKTSSACIIQGQKGMFGLYWGKNSASQNRLGTEETHEILGNVTSVQRLNYNDIDDDISLNGNDSSGGNNLVCGFGGANNLALGVDWRPNFTNTNAWQTLNPYYPGFVGQCTWYAFGAMAQVYGDVVAKAVKPYFTGNGCENVRDITNGCPQYWKFSVSPVPGAVFSCTTTNHVGFILACDSDTITFFDGNFDGCNNTWEIATKSGPGPVAYNGIQPKLGYDWDVRTWSKSFFNSTFGPVYAVPTLATTSFIRTSTSFKGPARLAPVYSTPSFEMLCNLANRKYHMSRERVKDALVLITYEGLGKSDMLDYYMACTVLNRQVQKPEKDIISAWAGGASSRYAKLHYYPESYIKDHAKIALYRALVRLDTRAWDCHGMIPENRAKHGGFNGTQHLDEAIYYEKDFTIWGRLGKFKGYYAVWPKEAKWYK